MPPTEPRIESQTKPKPVKFARIYITEDKHANGGSLYHELFHLLHETHQVRAVTVFRGVAGFGERGEIHASDLLRLKADLPLVLEFFDETAKVDAALKAVAPHLPPGHIVTWMGQCQ
ncbi:MAG: DUF190 domain-containing protein [Sinobacteraceae bacterium]|nr:DUF190 domain-containing protein [Nevskiaceae bacterium]